MAQPEPRRLGAPEAQVDSRPAFYPDERVIWLPDYGAIVFGDSFPGAPIPDDCSRQAKPEPITTRGSLR